MAGALSIAPAVSAPDAGDVDSTDGSELISVAFLSPSGQVGGAERMLLDMVASMCAADAKQSILVVTSAEGPLVEQARKLGARVTVLPFPEEIASVGDAFSGTYRTALTMIVRLVRAGPAVVQYARTLQDVLRAASPTVVHSNGAKMHLIGAFASAGVAPLIWHLHDYVGTRPFMRRALRACVGRCAAVVANSESVAVDARERLGGRVPVHTILNAVDLERFSIDGPSLDLDAVSRVAPLPADAVRIGLVATFARWKGHDLFFRAIAALPASLSLRAYVIGGPVYETQGSQYTLPELRALAASHGLADRVAFTSHVTDVASAMRALDIVVHASEEPEPFGLVIAEAMACGRAVITCGTGGAMEVAATSTGVTVAPPRDARGLAAAIERVARDPDLRRALGRAAREAAERSFDRVRLAPAIRTIHSSAVSAFRA